MDEEELYMFSRHTPKNLEKYKLDELSDKDIKKLRDGELYALLDDDIEASDRNESKYVAKKLPKWAGAGAALGAGIGALASPKGSKGIRALQGGLAGGFLGALGGTARGSSKAAKEGHNRSSVSRRLSRKIDKVRGSNLYKDIKESEERRLQRALDSERNAAIWANAMR